MSKNNLKEYIAIILRHEYDSGCYGMVTTEYTKDIIECEVHRLTRHRKPIDDTKPYLVIRGCMNTRLLGFENVDQAVAYSNKVWGEAYILHNGVVSIPMTYIDGTKLEVINY